VADRPLTTVPFDLRACPLVRVAEARATRAVAEKLAALPRSWQAEVPPFGSAKVAVTGIDRAPLPGEAVALTIIRENVRGRLSLAQLFAARLVDGALGGRGVFSVARELGPAERGVLVALLAPLLDAIGWSTDLAPALEMNARSSGHAIVLSVEGPFGAGVLWLDLPTGATVTGPSRSAPGFWRQRASGLPVEARLEIAKTHLLAGELARLATGDALVFDGVAFGTFAPEAEWVAQLAIGVHAAPLRIDRRGALSCMGDFQLTDAADGPNVALLKEGKERSMDVTGPTEMATAALAAAPIEIVAELARITLRGEEVLGLAPGVVLSVPADRSRAVLLRAGGEIWAEGELCNVEGELGVRVTRLLRP
jgi:flagellar motor switch/type III secretory pathway protein FliN